MGLPLVLFQPGHVGSRIRLWTGIDSTEARASGVGWAVAFGRIGAMIAPFIVGLIYQSYGKDAGYGIVFGMLTGVFILVALTVLILWRGTQGQDA